MLSRIYLVLLITVILLSVACNDDAFYNDAYDILIHGGTIVDGTGSDGYRTDVLIKENIIAYVGRVNVEKIEARKIIDATGKIVAPGFIDAHAHGDPLSTPEFENFLAMGVTTITLGQDGSSPMVSNISEWMDEVDEVNPGVNIGMFVGHGTARRLAEVGYKTEVDEEDLEEMAKLIDNAMQAGCFGLSTGLEYEPGSLAGMNELVAIAKPVAGHGGLVMSHMRSEDDDKIEDAIDELITQGIKAELQRVHVSHIKIVYANDPARAEAILAKMEEAREKGVQITADIYPYTASYTGIGIVFPDWAKPPHDYEEVVKTRRNELAGYLRTRVLYRNGPEATLFGTKPWAGMTLAEVAEKLDKPFENVLIDDIGPGGASAAYFVMNNNVMERFLIDPFVMISSDGSPIMRHPRGYGTFARIIRKYVNEKELLTLEEAIHKMTGLTAKTIGYDSIDKPRGFIKPNFAADLVIFNPENVRDPAAFAVPHLLAKGFDYVIVNGIPAIKDGSITGDRAGMVLRKKSIDINK